MEVQKQQGLKNAFNNVVKAARLARLSGAEHEEVARSAMEVRAALWPPKNVPVEEANPVVEKVDEVKEE